MHRDAGRVIRATASCHTPGKPGRSVCTPPAPLIFRHTPALSPALTARYNIPPPSAPTRVHSVGTTAQVPHCRSTAIHGSLPALWSERRRRATGRPTVPRGRPSHGAAGDLPEASSWMGGVGRRRHPARYSDGLRGKYATRWPRRDSTSRTAARLARCAGLPAWIYFSSMTGPQRDSTARVHPVAPVALPRWRRPRRIGADARFERKTPMASRGCRRLALPPTPPSPARCDDGPHPIRVTHGKILALRQLVARPPNIAAR